MEKLEIGKNGVISEEALDDISGGAHIDRKHLIKVLKGAGIAVASTTALAGAFLGGAYAEDKLKITKKINSGVKEAKDKLFSKKSN